MSDGLHYAGILHAGVLVTDVDRSLLFYRDLLGLALAPDRPALPFPGAWLQVGPQQIHLMQLPNVDPSVERPEYGGRDRHTAIGVSDLAAVISRLDGAGVKYQHSNSGQRIFCRDPDGNTLEIVQSQ